MAAGRYDFQIEQGATFRKVIRWRQSNGRFRRPNRNTGTTAKMQAWDNDHRAKLIDFNTQGSITIDAEAGSVTVGPPDTVTSTLTFDIAWLRPVAHQPEHRQDPLIQGRIRLSRQETA